MKSRKTEQKTSETKKPRFKIEKLEERIAPRHSRYHPYNGRGYNNGGGHGAGGSGGHCGHGACK